jgi:uncharacterized protein (DUF4415 family)
MYRNVFTCVMFGTATKSRANRGQHGVSFEIAVRVFDDPHALSVQDRIVDGEERWQTIGLIEGILVLLVAHTVSDSPREDGEETVRIISARKQPRASGEHMKRTAKDRPTERPLTKREWSELAALALRSDDAVDVSEAPEVQDWSQAVVGRFYRPVKQPVTLRLDADVLAWLRSHGPGYQTRINRLLRSIMEGHRTRRRRASGS